LNGNLLQTKTPYIGDQSMNFKHLTWLLIFILSNALVLADDVQVRLKLLENGPMGSGMMLQLKNSGKTTITFQQFKRYENKVYLMLVADQAGHLIRNKSWTKVEPIKIPSEPGYNSKSTGYISESFILLDRSSSKELYPMLLSMRDIPCLKQYYAMFVLRDNKQFYKTNILSFEKIDDHQMKQLDITKSGVPEAVSKTFADEIALLYQEEGLKLAAE